MIDYDLRHKVALLNPYKSVYRVFDADKHAYLVGIKNVKSIPNSLMHKLEGKGFSLHTIDVKSQLAGRAVDTALINPISGHFMSGSSSGTAINVFCGINDLGIGNDGGGSVLAPAISVNIYSFISKLIEQEQKVDLKPNTDGIIASNSIGFMARDKYVLYKAIKEAINIEPSKDYGMVFSDKRYLEFNSKVINVKDHLSPRSELVPYLQEMLSKCDVMVVSEGPIDLYGFGDSLFGHFSDECKQIQEAANKGYVRVCNIAGATAMSLPLKELGTAILLMCESKKDKVSKLLNLSMQFEQYHDELIERYFLDLNNYFIEGYEV